MVIVSKIVTGVELTLTFCHTIICATGTLRLKIIPVRCVEKYCLAKSDSENCIISEAKSWGKAGYVLGGKK